MGIPATTRYPANDQGQRVLPRVHVRALGGGIISLRSVSDQVESAADNRTAKRSTPPAEGIRLT